jgi:predicted TPR repeat methyltransferase
MQLCLRRGIYDDLLHEDVFSVISDIEENSFDLVVVTDVLPFFGNSFKKLLAGCRSVLSQLGSIVITADALEISDKPPEFGTDLFSFSKAGRYLHTEEYIRRTASDEGFQVVEFVKAKVYRGDIDCSDSDKENKCGADVVPESDGYVFILKLE